MLAALGVLLTTATQFRVKGLPLGPGEVVLVGWLIVALAREAIRRGPVLNPALSRLLIFWALFAVGESVGTVVAYAIGDVHDTGLFIHDLIAYPLMATFSCLLAAGPEAGARLYRVAVAFVVLGAVLLLPQLAAGWGIVSLPTVDPWFGDRFRGWSNNPNQLALLCAVLVLTALHLADRATTLGEWIIAVLSSIPPLIAGRLTKTDAFTFAVLLGTVLFTVAKLRIWATSRETRARLRPQIAVFSAMAGVLILVSVAPLTLSANSLDSLSKGILKNGGKEATHETDLRLLLWYEAISRGLDAYGLGLGPGPHLPIPWSIVAARQTETIDTGDHPKLNGTPNFEAHNTVFDLFAQGGAIASLSFIWLTGAAFAAGYKAKLAGVLALVTGLTIFALLDLVVREPVFWLAVVLCLSGAEGMVLRAHGRRGLPGLQSHDHSGAFGPLPQR